MSALNVIGIVFDRKFHIFFGLLVLYDVLFVGWCDWNCCSCVDKFLFTPATKNIATNCQQVPSTDNLSSGPSRSSSHSTYLLSNEFFILTWLFVEKSGYWPSTGRCDVMRCEGPFPFANSVCQLFDIALHANPSCTVCGHWKLSFTTTACLMAECNCSVVVYTCRVRWRPDLQLYISAHEYSSAFISIVVFIIIIYYCTALHSSFCILTEIRLCRNLCVCYLLCFCIFVVVVHLHIY